MGDPKNKHPKMDLDNPGSQSVDEIWTEIDGPIERQISVIVVGCGQRGKNYSAFAIDLPSRMRVAAIVEPMQHRRDK